MRTRNMVMTGTALVLLLWAFQGSMAGGATTTVHLADIAYTPQTVTISVGDTVHWVNDEAVEHSVTADDGSFDSSPGCPGSCLNQGDTFSHTFSTAGTFAYHCRIHGAAMTGTVVVRAATPPSASTAPAAPPTSGQAPTPATQPPAPAPGAPAPPTTVATGGATPPAAAPSASAPTPMNGPATFTG